MFGQRSECRQSSRPARAARPRCRARACSDRRAARRHDATDRRRARRRPMSLYRHVADRNALVLAVLLHESLDRAVAGDEHRGLNDVVAGLVRGVAGNARGRTRSTGSFSTGSPTSARGCPTPTAFRRGGGGWKGEVPLRGRRRTDYGDRHLLCSTEPARPRCGDRGGPPARRGARPVGDRGRRTRPEGNGQRVDRAATSAFVAPPPGAVVVSVAGRGAGRRLGSPDVPCPVCWGRSDR